MLRLNRMTDYAMIMLTALAMRDEALVPSAILAQQTQLNQTTIAKIGKALVQAGVIVAERGVNGGYRLARPASEITATQVIEALEGPIALTACVDGAEEPCATQDGCFLSGHWNQVNGAIRGALDEVTLKSLVSSANMIFSQAGPASQASFQEVSLQSKKVN